tara:strand:+ start:1119 stop:2162 length:1044 start_codon:yes stop_codon:yes gene_type:complete
MIEKKTNLNIQSGTNKNLRISNPIYSRTNWNNNTTKDILIQDNSLKENSITGRPLDIPTNQAGIIEQKGNIKFEKNRLSSKDFPSSSFLLTIIGARRTGKTTITESLLLNELKGRFDYIFLYSPTLSGMDSIPNNYKFRDLDTLPKLIEKQQNIVKNNIKITKMIKNNKDGIIGNDNKELEKKYKKSRICCILDDFAGSKSLRHNDILNKIATNGRHICSPDKSKNTEMCFIILSQSITLLDKVIRQNADLILSSRLTSKIDRKLLIEENMVLDSTRSGLQDSFKRYDDITLSKDYSFIAILNWLSNKNSYEKYIRSYTSNAENFTNIKMFGNKDDWKVELPFYNFS